MSDISKLKLLDDRVLVLPDKSNENSSSGLYIPEEARKEIHQGTVVLVGGGFIHPSADKVCQHLDILEATFSAPFQDVSKEGIIRHLSDIRKLIVAPVMKVSVGDKIVYGKFSGTEIEINEEKYILMQQCDIKIVINN